MPCNPRIAGRMISRGIKQRPLRSVASTDACFDWPVLWNIIFPMLKNGRKRQATLWKRRAGIPMTTTDGSLWNACTNGSAKTKQNVAVVNKSASLNAVAHQKPCLTREYFFAPKLKEETGWKPCPIPRLTEKMNCVILVTMLIAATAASPYTPAW